jgi:hypothetical protein
MDCYSVCVVALDYECGLTTTSLVYLKTQGIDPKTHAVVQELVSSANGVDLKKNLPAPRNE